MKHMNKIRRYEVGRKSKDFRDFAVISLPSLFLITRSVALGIYLNSLSLLSYL